MALLEITAVGDAVFVSRVLNATAMLSNASIFLGLGAIGALVGLFAVGLKAVSTQKMDLGPWAAGVICCLVMFVPRVDIVVTDVAPSFGRDDVADIRVDNVPIGIGVMGWMVSNVSTVLSRRMVTAFSWPGFDVGFDASGGTRAVEWLAALRRMSDPKTESLMRDETGNYRVLMMNLDAYIRRCVEMEVSANPGRMSQLMSSPNLMDPNTGFGSTDAWMGVDQWTNTPGPPHQVTLSPKSCAQASTDLAAQLNSADLTSTVAEAIGPALRMDEETSQEVFDSAEALLRSAAYQGYAGSANAAADAGRAMQRYVAAHVMHGALMKTLASSEANQQTMSLMIMIGDAKAQRNTQWVGEENMFLQMARPVSAFFESMVYICAPFMAFALGLGSFGMSLALRYSLLTLWVMFWGPTLAAINLFQVTMAEHAFAATIGNYEHSPADLGAIATSISVAEDAEAWIAIGSLLAASTPAITLMMLFGSAMTAVGLASRLQGADTLNEKTASPDAVSVGAATSLAPGFQATQMGATRASGAEQTTFSLDQARMAARTSEASYADQTSSGMMARWGSEIASTLQSQWGRTREAGSDGSLRSAYSGTAQIMGSKDFQSATEGLTREEKVAMAEAFQVKAAENKGSVDWGQAAMAVAALVATKNPGAASGVAGGGGALGAHSSATARDEDRTGERNANAAIQQAARRYASVLKDDAGERAEVVAAAGMSARDIARQDGTKANSFSERSGFEQSLNNVQSAANALRMLDSSSNSTGMRTEIDMNRAAAAVSGSADAMGTLRAAFGDAGGTQAGWDQLTKGEGAKRFTDMGYTPKEAAAASVLTHFAGGNAPQGYGDDYFGALTKSLGQAGITGLPNQTGSSAITGNEGQNPAQNVPDGREVRQTVGANTAEAPTSAAEGRVAAGVALGGGGEAAFNNWAQEQGLGGALAAARGAFAFAQQNAGTDPTAVGGGPALDAERRDATATHEARANEQAAAAAAPLFARAVETLAPKLSDVGGAQEDRRFTSDGKYEGEVAKQGSEGLGGLPEVANSIRAQLAVGPGADDASLGRVAAAVAFQVMAGRNEEMSPNGEYTSGKPTTQQAEDYSALLSQMSPQERAAANLIAGTAADRNENGTVDMRPEAAAIALGRYMPSGDVAGAFERAGVEIPVTDSYDGAADGVYMPEEGTTRGSRIADPEQTKLTPEQQQWVEKTGFDMPETQQYDAEADPSRTFGDSLRD